MRIVLAGAGGGIGRRIARRLIDRDHDVLALDRDRESLSALPDAVDRLVLDLTDESAVGEAIADRPIDAVVTAAGWYDLGAIEDCSADAFRQHLETNLLTVHTVVHALLPTLRDREGRIVVLGSMAGRVPLPYHGAYSTAKAGLHGYVTALRREIEPRGVDVSLVEPGPARTGLNERAAAALEERNDSVYARQYEAFDEYSPQSVAPEAIADRVVAAIDADDPDTRYVLGRRARWLPRLQWLLPARVFDHIVRSGMPGGLLARLVDR